jgi:hypothetical protein
MSRHQVIPISLAAIPNYFSSCGAYAGNNLAQKCAALTDPPTPDDLGALADAMNGVASATEFMGNVLTQDGSILTNAAR